MHKRPGKCVFHGPLQDEQLFLPVEYAGRTVGVKGYAEKVEVYAYGRLIAAHARCFGKHQSAYKLEHYMPLLERRGRAILNAAPVNAHVR